MCQYTTVEIIFRVVDDICSRTCKRDGQFVEINRVVISLGEFVEEAGQILALNNSVSAMLCF